MYFGVKDGQMPGVRFKPDKRISEDVGRKHKDGWKQLEEKQD